MKYDNDEARQKYSKEQDNDGAKQKYSKAEMGQAKDKLRPKHR